MKIYMMRHGESRSNIEKRLCGQTDVPLTEKGRQQAVDAREKIRDVEFAAVYVSPLSRALETARLVTDQPAQVVEDLMERNMGRLENLTWAQVEEIFGEEFSKAWFADLVDFILPDGESCRMLYERARRVLDVILFGHGEQDSLLIVAHGAILSCMIAALLDLGPAAADHIYFENCVVCRVDIHNGFGQLRKFY